jgi:hypothetical protein
MSLSVQTEVVVALGLQAEVDAHRAGRELAQLCVRPDSFDRVVFHFALLVDEFWENNDNFLLGLTTLTIETETKFYPSQTRIDMSIPKQSLLILLRLLIISLQSIPNINKILIGIDSMSIPPCLLFIPLRAEVLISPHVHFPSHMQKNIHI